MSLPQIPTDPVGSLVHAPDRVFRQNEVVRPAQHSQGAPAARYGLESSQGVDHGI